MSKSNSITDKQISRYLQRIERKLRKADVSREEMNHILSQRYMSKSLELAAAAVKNLESFAHRYREHWSSVDVAIEVDYTIPLIDVIEDLRQKMREGNQSIGGILRGSSSSIPASLPIDEIPDLGEGKMVREVREWQVDPEGMHNGFWMMNMLSNKGWELADFRTAMAYIKNFPNRINGDKYRIIKTLFEIGETEDGWELSYGMVGDHMNQRMEGPIFGIHKVDLIRYPSSSSNRYLYMKVL